ncbi:hypothetical protein WOLCODRAFT_22956 [Wolfiporia cocos MD-104 SS10]|uniref:Uncharacterized protein n=1 Tax=Wolfiporia cocos (strain MD-104) TaxID=742152 RepID=A0A2H3J6P9_WOLCO|nr:hypothetical protein WOLCODRAFT_22956 [Wolfiporia cocos MD-104 SS10]
MQVPALDDAPSYVYRRGTRRAAPTGSRYIFGALNTRLKNDGRDKQCTCTSRAAGIVYFIHIVQQRSISYGFSMAIQRP